MVAVPSRGRADAGLHQVAPEAAATRELYERHAAKIFAFCLGRLRDREEAEDATQSTFLNAFRGLQRGIAPEHEQAWLYKIAENVCLTRQRSRVRRRRIEAPGDLDALQDVIPSPAVEADELLQLPEALQGMPEQQRRALLLREWQGLSYREIADELDLSQAAVETLLFRARRSLADGLSDEPTKKRRLVARMGDTGSLAALLKTLFFSGGAKVLVAGAVAAGTVVAGSATVRHTLEDVVAPPPAHHAVPARHVAAPVVVAQPVVRHGVVAPTPTYTPAVVREHHAARAHHARPVAPAVRAKHEQPQHPAVVSNAVSPSVRHVAATTHGRSVEHRAAPAPQHNRHAVSPAARTEHARARRKGRANAAAHRTAPPASHRQRTAPPASPTPAPAPQSQPTPADQVTGVVTQTEDGLGNALGHAKK